MDIQQFINGTAFEAHEYFGAQPETGGVVFRTWAPKAGRVAVTGEFNGWTETDLKKSRNGVFSCRIPGARVGQMYKFVVYSKRGTRREHFDPYGLEPETGRGHCAVICKRGSYRFHDSEWMKERTLNFDRPLNIYELHVGSWLRPDGRGRYTFAELAEPLIEYLKEFSFTHVEFLPLAEHPMEGSWGYQQTGFFAPAARYGTVDELKYLIDRLHQEKLGVILDFVSVHFAVDAWGLKNYDSSACFESRDKTQQKSDWGSLLFDHSRGEVRSFLQSAAHYWLEEYHFDGLRMDAVSHLLYAHGDGRNGEYAAGIAFLRGLNRGLAERHPTAMRIAEDSTAFPRVTWPVEEDGLGFTYKWDMGWTFDTLQFFHRKPAERAGQSRLLTFSTDYFRAENYLLPLSHDQVGGKHSLAGEMPGTAAERLQNAKLLYLYQAVHPGKTMTFMGNEFGTPLRWDMRSELDWQTYKKPEQLKFALYCKALYRLAGENSALYEADYTDWSTRWLVCDDDGDGVYAMVRHSAARHVVAVWNFSAQARSKRIPLEHLAKAGLLLHSEWERFGGTVKINANPLKLTADGLQAELLPLSCLLAEVWFT